MIPDSDSIGGGSSTSTTPASSFDNLPIAPVKQSLENLFATTALSTPIWAWGGFFAGLATTGRAAILVANAYFKYSFMLWKALLLGATSFYCLWQVYKDDTPNMLNKLLRGEIRLWSLNTLLSLITGNCARR